MLKIAAILAALLVLPACVGSVELDEPAEVAPAAGEFVPPPAPSAEAVAPVQIGCWKSPGVPFPDGAACLLEDTIGPEHVHRPGLCQTWMGLDTGVVGHSCELP